MSKLLRVNQKIFASTAGANEIGQFGSLAAGSPATTTDPAVVQSLSNFLDGWFSAILGGNSPAIEDMNALCFLFARQLAYNFQSGIPEWEVGTTYFKGSIVNVSGDLYTSLTDNNTGNVTTNATNWSSFSGNSKFYFVESLTQVARALRNSPASTLQDYITEAFNLSDTGRLVLTNTAVDIQAQQLSLTSTNLNGSMESENFIQNDKNEKVIEFSARFGTDTVFDVSSGVSMTSTILTSASDRHLEIYNGTTSYGWFIKMERSSTSYEFKPSHSGYRVSVTGSTGSTNITVTHSALTFTIPAPTSTLKYVFVHEPIQPVQSKIAAGSYTDVVPSRISQIPGLSGLAYPADIHSFWKINQASGGEPNFRLPGGGFDLSQSGTVPTGVGHITSTSRGPFSNTNYLYWPAGGSNTTPYDSQTFFVDGWFQTSDLGNDKNLVGKTDGSAGFYVYILTDNKLYIQIASGGIKTLVSSGTVTDGNWHYFAGVYSNIANGYRLYLDNVLQQQDTQAAGLSVSTEDFRIGLRNTATWPFIGQLESFSFMATLPSYVDIENIINNRWNGGAGANYGGNIFTLYGALPGQSATSGDRFAIRAGMRREISTANPSLQSLSASF